MQNRARSGLSAAQFGHALLPSILTSIGVRSRVPTGAGAGARPRARALPCGAARCRVFRRRRRGATRHMPKGSQINSRRVIALALALACALLVAACGGGGGGEDPHQVLDQTFNNPTSIRSGTFDLDFKVETSGGDNPGQLEVKLGGKFEAQQSGQLPRFDVDVSLKAESGSQSFSGSGGLTSTGSQAFVNFQGTEFAGPQQLYDEFTTSYAQLQSRNGRNRSTNPLGALGISPINWITDLKNEGTEDVEGTKTIHISGSANVPKLVDDLKTIALKAGS